MTAVTTRGPGIPSYGRPAPRVRFGTTVPGWRVVISLFAVLAVEAVSRSGLIDRTELIPPTEMAVHLSGLLADPVFVTGHLLPTVAVIGTTFVLAGVIGVALAYVQWRSRWWRGALRPYLSVFYAAPSFALYPVMVVLFGTGATPIVVMATVFAGVVVVTSALRGFDAVPATVDALARANRLGPRAYATRILLPSAAPEIVAGLRMAMTYCTIAVLAMEFILSTRGLGHFISNAYHTFATDDMYAGILLVCILALVLNVVALRLLAHVDWRRS